MGALRLGGSISSRAVRQRLIHRSANAQHSTSSGQPLQKYPLYPSVQALLEANGIASEADKITASGPGGRLLKGDVLGYLGQIQKGYSAEQSSRIKQNGRLDLSNIQRAEPKPQPKVAPPVKEETVIEPEPDTEVAVSVSLSAVLATQKRINESLGLTLPLSTFIARASEIANETLPRPRAPPTSDELFEAVLGVDKVKKTSRGTYMPNVTALADDTVTRAVSRATQKAKTEDAIDILTGHKSSRVGARQTRKPAATGVGSSNSTNVFSVSAKKGEEQRARIYLERVKSVLEVEPGRCVL
ncbi:MAG: hypothetical protein Q9162_000086 [Coniocarpon cinnabarinum]